MHDDELDDLRARVDCRAVLEKAGWELDAAESTAHAVKYRGGSAAIVIVTHEGKGWFDPLNDTRGDVLALAQRLWGGTLGHARKALRPLAGLSPQMRPSQREKRPPTPLDAPKTWSRAHQLKPGSQGWTYLTGKRGLPAATIERALSADLLREGIYGTVWALHRDSAGCACGWEMRGPQYKGFAKGGDKALFWIGELASAQRIAVTESWIDALSLATLETWPDGTAYISTGGGFGPGTADVLRELLPRTARLVAATDQGKGGELLSDRLHELAATVCAGFGRLRPTAKDWNAQLTKS
ncbi:DUF3991 domain-containing protein [Salmonella enterica]|jgi:hypothetical protein|uniref:DUF3991 and TOPRIM domain-containing protein n=1 Tax=Pseudomonadota TaxID=1224 RepID=UPI000761FEDA|nr:MULTISPECIES: DUF3991 and TOPRIM domain-containing protein [Pseudomonadota]EAB1567114.1 DUF3991 domain-containing protein [Salmonella enterica]ECE0326005.1 DUF3991 domain-containing protein [Salmonella enterica subsp. enterica]ELK6626049.1 DUF3991 and TOPRIM domain-containing protein [Citrobacter amalonaticus]HCJ7377292.1 DUF3991 and TOPRIM domain-containing protein [Enterobacter hormaechei subsp. xiangfangensis]EAB1716138.1 DUF3991 domain-containing protein [Salmonella enterica]